MRRLFWISDTVSTISWVMFGMDPPALAFLREPIQPDLSTSRLCWNSFLDHRSQNAAPCSLTSSLPAVSLSHRHLPHLIACHCPLPLCCSLVTSLQVSCSGPQYCAPFVCRALPSKQTSCCLDFQRFLTRCHFRRPPAEGRSPCHLPPSRPSGHCFTSLPLFFSPY